MDIEFLWSCFKQILVGLPITLILAISSLCCGFILALFIAWLRQSHNIILASIARFYVFAFRGSPLLIQIFLIYYGAGQFRSTFQSIGIWWILREPMYCAIIALSLNTTAYSSEIMRGALLAVPHSNVEVGKAYGMTPLLIFRRIIFPLALRQGLPAYSNEIILMVKSTSLASVITILDMTGIATTIISETYRAIEVFIVAGFLYLILNFLITRAIALWENKLLAYTRPPSGTV